MVKTQEGPPEWWPSRRCDGGQGRSRTADTLIFSQVLYQLSYLATRADGYYGFRKWLSTRRPEQATRDDHPDDEADETHDREAEREPRAL